MCPHGYHHSGSMATHIYIIQFITIHMYSGITSGRVLNEELLYTKMLEVNLFAFVYMQYAICLHAICNVPR